MQGWVRKLEWFGLLIERSVRYGIQKVISEMYQAEEFEPNKETGCPVKLFFPIL